jgi:hypothetical protein
MDASTNPTSPFLPNTTIQYAWDSTTLGYLKRCPRLYYYTIICGWTTTDDSVDLRFGIEYHRALQEYDIYKAGGAKHNDAVRRALRGLLTRNHEWPFDHKYKTKEALIRTTLWYLEKFRDDPAQTYIMESGKPAVELSFRFELDWGPESATSQPYMLTGHLDRVVRFNEEHFVMDRKTTTKTLTDYYFAQFEPDNQMTLYSLAAKVILEAPIKGVIVDAAQVMAEASRFVRNFTYRTDTQLDEWIKDLETWLSFAEYYAEQNYWPQNDTACDKYGGCRFRQVCSKAPQVRDQFLNAKFVQLPKEERWNPLKPR